MLAWSTILKQEISHLSLQPLEAMRERYGNENVMQILDLCHNSSIGWSVIFFYFGLDGCGIKMEISLVKKVHIPRWGTLWFLWRETIIYSFIFPPLCLENNVMNRFWFERWHTFLKFWSFKENFRRDVVVLVLSSGCRHLGRKTQGPEGLEVLWLVKWF